MTPVRFTVPGAPVAKGRPRLGTIKGQARAFTPAKTRAYEAEVRHYAAEAMRGRALIEGAVAVEVTAFLPIPKSMPKRDRARIGAAVFPTTRPDVDNYLKSVLDALNGVVIHDDAQVVTATAAKLFTADQPCLAVTISEAWRSATARAAA